MRSDENQRLVFEYLLARFRDQEPFLRVDLQNVTSWTESSFETYWSKQFKRFLVKVHAGQEQSFRVGESFRLYSSWERFQKHVTQARGGSSDYTSLVHDNIIVFEFFMPLTNEEHLRTSLDALFYTDTVLRRLKSVDRDRLTHHFPRSSDDTEDVYLENVAAWIGGHFGGYSISHVNGRFRASEIVTRSAAAEIQQDGARYLIDETTAVVRFIFPCGEPVRGEAPLSADSFAEDIQGPAASPDARTFNEASKIRWTFGVLFVQSIVQVVNGEAEIWMVESGMRNRLHIWRVETAES